MAFGAIGRRRKRIERSKLSRAHVAEASGVSGTQAREWLPAGAIRAAGVKPATLTLNGAGFLVLSFADGQEQYGQSNLIIPDDIDRAIACYICVGWSSPTTSQDCDWEIEYLITAEDDDTDQAGTTAQDYAESSATADGLVVSSIATIAGGTISADDICIHTQVMRDGDDGSDNLGDVAELHGMALLYTRK